MHKILENYPMRAQAKNLTKAYGKEKILCGLGR